MCLWKVKWSKDCVQSSAGIYRSRTPSIIQQSIFWIVSMFFCISLQFPWQVEIQINTNPFLPNDNVCGGALISRNWVISARHCFQVPLEAKGAHFQYTSTFWVGKLYSYWSVQKLCTKSLKNRFSSKPTICHLLLGNLVVFQDKSFKFRMALFQKNTKMIGYPMGI